MATGRTLHVRCPTWDQVEQFYTRKLRKGNLLSMKVPFPAPIGMPITLGLELPNGVTIAIDGAVQKSSPVEGTAGNAETGKTWIEIELVGFTGDVLARIKAMAAGTEVPLEAVAPAAPATTPRLTGEDLPEDERRLFQHLTSELRRMRQVAVHEVLGVEHDASADTVRSAWMAQMRRHHPDLVARRKAPAITHLAEELTILSNRAYDRLRAALVAETGAVVVGSVIKGPPGWLVGFDELGSAERTPAPKAKPRSGGASKPPVLAGTPHSGPAVPHDGESYETRARQMLGQGEAGSAQEVLAAALVVYPRSRPLRSLYYVASAMAALGKGEVMLATSQLETALAHYDQCREAARLLDHLRKHDPVDHDAMLRVFQ
ncbi:MAG: hypothetical protein H0T42_17680 [Deltaproteobacteria bacterium]|nr:hypothetical protein [Deltaproteobacteria bacterium]